eukprot:6222022-Karenia_brevis.AAC.1
MPPQTLAVPVPRRSNPLVCWRRPPAYSSLSCPPGITPAVRFLTRRLVPAASVLAAELAALPADALAP